MNCKQAQRLFDGQAGDRLPESLAADLHKHLADCTDCRVQQQRAARLLRLLALKRYEQPAPGYFEGFAAEFHRRLAAEQRPPATSPIENFLRGWDEILNEWLQLSRFGFAGAFGLVLALGLLWNGFHRPEPPVVSAPGQSAPAHLAEAVTPEPQSTPRAVVAELASQPVEAPAGGVVLVSASPRAEPAAPRYVLDRVTITPASYEVRDVQF
jgi:hypothetical protein